MTTGGGYSDVSQADDGTMIALNGVRLHRLARDGSVLANFDTPVSDTRPAPSKTFYGPFDPAISPDGTKVAYTYYYMTQSQSPTCFPPTCVTTINEAGTGYSFADRQTGWDEQGMGYHSGWRHPSWVDNDMTMISDPSHLPNRDVILDRICDGGNGNGNMVLNWSSRHGPGQPAHVRRRHHARQAQDGLPDGRERLDADASTTSRPSRPSWKDGEPNAGSDPHVCYRYSDAPGGAFGVPTWAPDGGAAGLARGRRHPRRERPVLRRRLHARRRDPGAAARHPRRPRARLGPGRRPAAAHQHGRRQQRRWRRHGGQTGGSAKLSVKVLSATRSGGVKVNVKVAGKGKLTATAKLGKKVVGSASKKVAKAGTTAAQGQGLPQGQGDPQGHLQADLRRAPRPRPLNVKIR